MTDTMTSKERWLAAIIMKPVDHLPFWPKLDGAYPRAQTSPYSDMSNSEIHEWIGSDQHIGIATGICEVRKKSSMECTIKDGINRVVYRTPTRELTSASQFDEASNSWHPTEFPVKNLILHMCGHLKGILPELSTIKAQAFEAFTSPTLGNTTLLDGRSACPDKCLIGGTNAILWTKSAKEIIEGIEEALDELPHHRGIVVTSAGVMPPLCKPETIKEVCEWVKQYPART